MTLVILKKRKRVLQLKKWYKFSTAESSFLFLLFFKVRYKLVEGIISFYLGPHFKKSNGSFGGKLLIFLKKKILSINFEFSGVSAMKTFGTKKLKWWTFISDFNSWNQLISLWNIWLQVKFKGHWFHRILLKLTKEIAAITIFSVNVSVWGLFA